MKTVLQGLSVILVVIAGISFFVGGLVISEISKTGRALAEVEGIGLAFACGLLAFIAKSVADNLDDDEDSAGR